MRDDGRSCELLISRKAIMPAIVRRASLTERIKAYFNPWDWLLWISEELNDNEWEEFWKGWATPLGVVLNIVFMITRANSGWISRSRRDDVFGDYEARRGSGWLIWFVSNFLKLFHCEELSRLTLLTFSSPSSSTSLSFFPALTPSTHSTASVTTASSKPLSM